ncbi:2618_t:CDS:2 [Funneliformis geosporum]|nr:2618_t:CDS:2 [Funneliformis geosporum]
MSGHLARKCIYQISHKPSWMKDMEYKVFLKNINKRKLAIKKQFELE